MITFHRAIDIARRIEIVCAQERGSVPDKRPCHSGSFSGASSGGKGTFGRGHPPMPFQLALQASHSALGSHRPYIPHSGQPAYNAPSAPISAPPIQSYQLGYPTRSGHLQLQLPQQQDRCFKCGGTSHIKRFCLRLLGGMPQQSSHAMVLALVAPLPVQPARGKGQAARVCHRNASVLFDPVSTFSYVSSYFASYLVVPLDSLSAPVYNSTAVGDSIIIDCVYRSCVITIRSLESSVDLICLDILMLSRARRMVKKGYLAYLAYVCDSSSKVPSMDLVPVVREFPEVFLVDLSGIPPDRDIDFCIDLALGTQPISIPPYCMAPPKLKK
ncbi:uncharacterized protein [Nicotiana tomentosiformis]|uniref:uncharacterized protein n=1 Tax=Nicotiana tomentosiformis TaxID=4098 RepID=UPI00388CD2BF